MMGTIWPNNITHGFFFDELPLLLVVAGSCVVCCVSDEMGMCEPLYMYLCCVLE